MNYEKLTVDLFIQKCKEGKYAGLTGARRAIGKTDWSEKDRKTAHAFADKYFEGKGGKVAKAAAPKRQPKPAKAKTERAPRTVKRAKKSAKPAASALPKRAPATTSDAPRPVRTPVVPGPSPRMAQGDDPSTVRAHSAALVISALRNSGPLSAQEQHTYDIAISEYSSNAREVARRAVEAASGGLPFPKSEASPAGEETPSNVSVAPGTAPRVEVPANGVDPATVDTSNMTPELKAQHDRLVRAREAANAQSGPPPRAS